MKKAVKEAERISSKISSPMIVDLFESQGSGIMPYLKNALKTRLALNQTESCFIDFKRSQFPLFAKDRYFEFLETYNRKDKVDLIRLLSVPLYDIVKVSLKDNKPLPFKLYKEMTDAQLVQARLFSQKKMALQSSQTWHQITVKFNFIDPETKKDVVKYNVLERRESDSSEKDWRICKLD
ncbi:unnamed protein product (macronuclear) [Paramecium tetraurelia]|uniref:Tim44-like domain-containing protein n=1 Tax=Paramecium tetraurelia TaxID=5888 RepID=A0D3N0_PARTE|nr:uncharacterized protein GSPATT00013135001 [Paramecium tetraurelia]CAK77647.1 unnamed protein product [Paramecium tetraurelia]|eukprot:XP_001445044.1 hypothetical protein (macronuclear) [Paramecium tetraurelia strain d4-2]